MANEYVVQFQQQADSNHAEQLLFATHYIHVDGGPELSTHYIDGGPDRVHETSVCSVTSQLVLGFIIILMSLF